MTSIASLLQAALALLAMLQQTPNLPADARDQALALANQSVQLATLETRNPADALAMTVNIWPTAAKLRTAAYLDESGRTVHLGTGSMYYYPGASGGDDPNHFMQFIDSAISFGDLNNDGNDDAVAILKVHTPDGVTRFGAAAMLNHNGNLYEIGAAPLGISSLDEITDHRITADIFTITFSATVGAPATTQSYQLIGNRFVAR
jgi:hypothetical protein